jgi:hypothetical protein
LSPVNALMVVEEMNQTWRDYKNNLRRWELLFLRISFALREGWTTRHEKKFQPESV